MNDTSYKTLSQIASEMRIPLNTLKVKVHLGNKLGIQPPPRKRIGRCYLYDTRAFALWLWENADLLKRPFEFGAKKKGDEDGAE